MLTKKTLFYKVKELFVYGKAVFFYKQLLNLEGLTNIMWVKIIEYF